MRVGVQACLLSEARPKALNSGADLVACFHTPPGQSRDLVLFSGALRHIRGHWPDARISLCVRSYGMELFRHCPYVDEILTYEQMEKTVLCQGALSWMPSFRGSGRLSGLLRRVARRIFIQAYRSHIDAYRSDIAMLPILAPVREYHECIRRIPSPVRVGICGNTTNQSLQTDQESRGWYSSQLDASKLPWNLPEVEVTRAFLEFLGVEVKASELWPEFWTAADDRQKIDSWIPIGSGGLRLGIAPGCSSPRKCLPPEWFVKALDGLPRKDLQLILIGSVADVALCNEIAKAISRYYGSTPLIDLSGKTNVREMVECVRRCDLLLCQESAALHVATALRKPVVGIVGGGHYGRFFTLGEIPIWHESSENRWIVTAAIGPANTTASVALWKSLRQMQRGSCGGWSSTTALCRQPPNLGSRI